jgi:hypothetical protein
LASWDSKSSKQRRFVDPPQAFLAPSE